MGGGREVPKNFNCTFFFLKCTFWDQREKWPCVMSIDYLSYQFEPSLDNALNYNKIPLEQVRTSWT